MRWKAASLIKEADPLGGRSEAPPVVLFRPRAHEIEIDNLDNLYTPIGYCRGVTKSISLDDFILLVGVPEP